MDILYVIAGLVLLFIGGEGLLRGSISIARRFKLSDLLVSAVIVGFGTSMPELSVSVGAALKGAPEIAIGNIVGSNIANVLLILAVCAVVCPIVVRDEAVLRDAVMVIFASLLLCGLAVLGYVPFWAGTVFLLILTGYVYWSYRQDVQANDPQRLENAILSEEDAGGEKILSTPLASVFVLAGLGMLVAGATFLVEGATGMARALGISEAVIGLSLVAVGTSVPELATGLIAAFKKHSDVVIGNILGSNFFNILGILGITSLIKTIPFTGHIASIDVWIMLAIAVILIPMLKTGNKISRVEGGLMLVLYAGYMGWLYAA